VEKRKRRQNPAKDYIRGIVDYGIEDEEDSYGLSRDI